MFLKIEHLAIVQVSFYIRIVYLFLGEKTSFVFTSLWAHGQTNCIDNTVLLDSVVKYSCSFFRLTFSFSLSQSDDSVKENENVLKLLANKVFYNSLKADLNINLNILAIFVTVNVFKCIWNSDFILYS